MIWKYLELALNPWRESRSRLLLTILFVNYAIGWAVYFWGNRGLFPDKIIYFYPALMAWGVCFQPLAFAAMGFAKRADGVSAAFVLAAFVFAVPSLTHVVYPIIPEFRSLVYDVLPMTVHAFWAVFLLLFMAYMKRSWWLLILAAIVAVISLWGYYKVGAIGAYTIVVFSGGFSPLPFILARLYLFGISGAWNKVGLLTQVLAGLIPLYEFSERLPGMWKMLLTEWPRLLF